MMAARSSKWPTLGALEPDVPAALSAVPVTGLAIDSRRVEPGFVFVALRGAHHDGLEFVDAAIAAGAVAVLHEYRADTPVAPRDDGIPFVGLDNLRERLGQIADRFYGSPSTSLHVAGITGTNGKTTVARLLAEAASACGLACGSSGTLGFGRPGRLRASTLTTPDAIAVHAQLANLRDDGATHVAMEVSSHALDQRRVAGVRFDTAVFTNLTRDHLDYHGTMQAYLEAKQRLFEWPRLRHAVVNVDDAAGRELAQRQGPELTVVGHNPGPRGAAVSIAGVDTNERGIDVRLRTPTASVTITSPLLGAFNASNLALAFAVLRGWGVAEARAARALGAVGAPPGRMEAFGGGERPLVVVDYAHTPDALDNALRAARSHCAGKLWVVFGCGGERDPGKRPLMGAIAARGADRVVITDDNPRREDANAIIAGIVAGAPDATNVVTQPGRREAIARAITAARAGDVVLLAGKGHEDYQLIGGERLAFSDRDEVLRLVGERQ